MPTDDVTSADSAEMPQLSTWRRPGPVQTVSNNTSALTLGNLARAQAQALANSVCVEIAHE